MGTQDRKTAAHFHVDAILGLRELMEGHPGLIGLNLTALVNSCVRLIGDEVR